MDRDEILLALTGALATLAETVPCACMPYRGGTTQNYHWDTCRWAAGLEFFAAACEALGVAPESLPDLKLKPAR
jgi:hypothetical protein